MQEKLIMVESFDFVGYDFCGGSDDGHTIFMFVDSQDENKGFTLSLRDHEGFDDHNQVHYEGDSEVPTELTEDILVKLKFAANESQDETDVAEVINRCIAGIN